MKKLLLAVVMSAVAIIVFPGCESNEDPKTYDLTFDGSFYEMAEGMAGGILIVTGNGKYETDVADPAVIDAEAHRASGFGTVYVTAKQPGTTIVTVTDTKTGQKVPLTITVFPQHMMLTPVAIATDIAGINDPQKREELEQRLLAENDLAIGYRYVLLKDEARTLLLFNPATENETYPLTSSQIEETDTYQLGKKADGSYFLTLSVSEFILLNDYTIAAFEHVFGIRTNNPRALDNSNGLLVRDLTEKYKTYYEELTKAYVVYNTTIAIPTTTRIVSAELLGEK